MKRLVIGASLAASACALAFAAGPADPASGGSGRVTITVKNATLTLLAEELHTRSGMNIAVDSFGDEYPGNSVEIRDQPPETAARAIARLFEREVVRLPTITVLRAPLPTLRARQELFSARVYHLARKPVDTLEVSAQKLRHPWDTWDVTAKEVTFRALAERAGRLVGAPFTLHPDLRERRCSLFARGITGVELALALAALADGTPAVAIARTQAQEKAEREAIEKRSDDPFLKERQWSEELAAELLPALRPDQLRELQARGRLTLDPGDWPPGVAGKVSDYIRKRSEAMVSRFPADNNLDLSRLGEFGIMIYSSGKRFSVIGRQLPGSATDKVVF